MRTENRTVLILLSCLALNICGKENIEYLQKSKINLFKIDLHEQAGQPVQIPCDVLSYQEKIKWIEWRKSNSSTLLLVKYPNYQVYINPEFSTRFNMDKYGGLLINPLLQQDAATYECRSFMLWDNITAFVHGSSINLKIKDEEFDSKTVKHVTIGHSAIFTCKLKNNSDTSKMLLGYAWTKNNVDVTVDPRFTVLMWGGLLVRRAKVEDAGAYKCTAKTLSDEDVPRVYRGVEVKMDILYPPTIILTKAKVMASEGSDVQLPCTSRGNPSLITTKWLWNGKHLPKSSNAVIFPNGTLFLRNVNTDHEGVYNCAPFNKIGLGNSAETILKVEAQPLFTQVPPRKLTAKLGESLTLICKATTSRVTWRKVNESLPQFRTTSRSGCLHIRDLQLEDSGVYECKVSSSRKSLRRSVEVLVVSTPVPPVIKNVEMLSKSAAVSWERGYDGGSRQTLEIWYRLSSSNDYHWKTIRNIPADVTTYTLYDVEPQQSYLFSMRGVNKMGFGVFSRIFRSDRFTSANYQHDNGKAYTKPLAPSNVNCTRTATGYQISWSYNQTPGRPQVQYFLIEYRRLNSSLKWKSLGTLINWERRQWSISTDIVNPNVLYEFRMFSFGEAFSEPSNVAKTAAVIDSIISLKSSNPSNNVVIAVCFASVMAVLLVFASYCYCYRVSKKRKNDFPEAKKINRNYRLSQPYSSTESALSDSEFDSCDLRDVKFIPNVSSFVLESQEKLRKSHVKKAARTKCEHKLLPLGEGYITCAVVGTLTDKSNTQRHKGTLEQDCFPQNYERYFCSQDDVPMVFNTGRLLPEFPELRDSYDQFCTTSEHSSRDDLDGKLSNRGSGMTVLSELKSARGMRDSMYSSNESVHACKRRRKTILEQVDTDGKNHRWSMPEFTKLWKDNCDSDPDYYLNDQYDSFVHQKDGQSFSEQSTQTCSTPVLSKRNSNQSLREYPHSEANTPDYPNIEKTKSAAKERIVLGESKSCPSLVSVERSTSYDARDYNSSGFYDDSGDDSLTSSPMRSRTSVNTVKENPQWHGYKADLKDSGIYANEDVDSTASVSEINVYASDSGYSGVSKGARDSPEGEETYFDQIEEKHVDRLSQPKHIRENSNSRADYTNNDVFENYDKGHVCDLEPHFKKHHKAHLGKETLHGEKGKRCAQLMQEYIVNKTLDSYTPSSSFYRTSAV